MPPGRLRNTSMSRSSKPARRTWASLTKQAQPRTKGSINVGAKGSSSITNEPEYAGILRTKWGEEQYYTRMKALHFRATEGQRKGLITEILALEQGLIGL